MLFCLMALVVSLAAFPVILKLARRNNITDKPNARKLQSRPIPVMGGLVVFIGWITAMMVAIYGFHFYYSSVWWRIATVVIMFLVGTVDDIRGLSPMLRFLVEIGVICIMIFAVGTSFDCFHGLWGLQGTLPKWFYIAFTIFAGVGIINAVNLIDGVDGYCSGYCIMACIVFAIFFFSRGDNSYAVWALSCAGAVVPFLLHNVFGRDSKMYLGDSGTLMMGTVLAMFVFRVLCGHIRGQIYSDMNCCIIAFTLAIFAIPVFDTLRVMSRRILMGQSPFHPDKTHLHHLFIEMGFSHVGTTVCLITANFFVVLVWWIAFKLHCSIDAQFYIVVVLCVMETWGFYGWIKRHQRRNTPFYQSLLKIGEASHMEREGVWKWMRRLMDGRLKPIKR